VLHWRNSDAHPLRLPNETALIGHSKRQDLLKARLIEYGKFDSRNEPAIENFKKPSMFEKFEKLG
jgi:hypothetical protein